jgi:hypothetical protein
MHLCRSNYILNSRARKQVHMVLQTAKGYPEAVLMGACEVVLFYKIADWLRQKIGITFTNKTEYAGSINWQFQFAGALMLLRYIPTAGISLCPAALMQATDEDRGAFKKLAETLQFD